MSTDLEAIDAAIMRALDPLRISPANRRGQFRLVDRWSGQLADQETLHQEILNKTPACLIAFDGEDGTERKVSLNGSTETMSESNWLALVIVADTRAGKKTVASTQGVQGAYKLVDKVQQALTNLYIAGLYRTHRLRFRNTRVVLAVPGEIFVLGVRFTAVRHMQDAPMQADIDVTTFDDMVADLNLEHNDPDGDAAAAEDTLRVQEQPFDQIDADT